MTNALQSMSLLELQTLSSALDKFVKDQPETNKGEALAERIGEDAAAQALTAEKLLAWVETTICDKIGVAA